MFNLSYRCKAGSSSVYIGWDCGVGARNGVADGKQNREQATGTPDRSWKSAPGVNIVL
jgi:hypothetical protein